MPLRRRRRLFHPLGDGTFEVNLPVENREGLLALAEDLEQIQTSDSPATRRLFPTAYPHDPERDAGYQIFARDELIEKRSLAVETIRRTVEADSLDVEELSTWLGVLNDLRLVLGTTLDVSEDDDEIDFDAPDADTRLLYHYLGEIVSAMVDALTTALPEPDDDPAPG